ncbi:MAG: ribosomal protein S18-alanine N-acetyltransferase [Gammaproteobacteria bacterium]|jgi:ribosomal-protein-alanine N-acetyltransferase|nr:ribosomal protein S18-alanine N-acetyltransferase [Gammaproteobacteria bacterium]
MTADSQKTAIAIDEVIQSDNKLSFRTMTKVDLDQVMAIEAEAHSHPWTRGIFQDCLRLNRCWLALQGETIAGYGILMMAPGESHVLNLCVKLTMQRQGVGRGLLRLMMQKSEQSGVDMILLEVRCSNQSAIELYQSEGFHELGVRKAYYHAHSGREDAIIFAKYLG